MNKPDYSKIFSRQLEEMTKLNEQVQAKKKQVTDDETSVILFNSIRKTARRGKSYSQCMLADMYYNGCGCEKNLELAAKWYVKAANKNNKRAQFRSAQMYENGEGVMQDCTKAFHWYCKCADSEEIHNYLGDAENKIGMMYENGVGTEKDMHKAFDYYLKAAEHDNIDAMLSIALMYEHLGGDNYKNALLWYEKAAQSGSAVAQIALAYKYEYGDSFKQDHEKAIE